MAVSLGLVAALISPAGAAVRDWVGDAVDEGREPALPALTSLPSPGSLLVDSARGPWVVREDGSKRLLGSYAESTWSPRGLHVAVTGTHELAAVDPMGEVRWTLTQAGSVTDPAWSPDGYRVAYLNGGALRVVAGDGTGDHQVASAAAARGSRLAAAARRSPPAHLRRPGGAPANRGRRQPASRSSRPRPGRGRSSSPGRGTAPGCWSSSEARSASSTAGASSSGAARRRPGRSSPARR